MARRVPAGANAQPLLRGWNDSFENPLLTRKIPPGLLKPLRFADREETMEILGHIAMTAA